MMKSGSKIQDTTNTFRHSSKLFSEKPSITNTDTNWYTLLLRWKAFPKNYL